ncbi:hypothetical protein HYR99_24560, partial [Candidatus Poribacteria bacterium]|nr:hypothetical protein [Candidatus Poribacteria bacterium]
MKRRHNLTFSSKDRKCILPKLQQIGIRLKDDSLINFKIDEDAHQWPEVKRLMEEFHVKIDMCEALFSPEELRAASWLVMEPAWHHGYPQPEDEYRLTTYALTYYCQKCGIGTVQIAPFHMRAE